MVFGVGIFYIAQNQQRKGGLAAWRVINLFLGSVTVGVGFIFLVFGGTPDEVWWLSKREKRMAKARIVENATGSGEQQPWRWEQVKECLVDPQYWYALVSSCVARLRRRVLTLSSSTSSETFLTGESSATLEWQRLGRPCPPLP